jgi:hypothetical protein
MAIKETRPKPPRQRPPSTRQLRRAEGIDEPRSAVVLLRADHREVERLFKEFKRAASGSEKQAIAKRVCAALELHAQIEEEIFYPAFIAATGEKALHDEALVEHDAAKKLIADIEAGSPADPMFDAKVTVLAEMIKHHVKDEERFGGLFFRARVAHMDLDALGVLLEARKRELAREPADGEAIVGAPAKRADGGASGAIRAAAARRTRKGAIARA